MFFRCYKIYSIIQSSQAVKFRRKIFYILQYIYIVLNLTVIINIFTIHL